MKTLNFAFLAFTFLCLCSLGCKKENDLKVVEEVLTGGESIPGENPEEKDQIAANYEQGASKGKGNKEQEHARCNVNFTLINKMFKKMIVETYFQSALVGMPGLKDKGSTSLSRFTTCPETSLSDNTNYPTTMTLDYGGGCEPAMGLTVSGTLIIDFSGPIEQPGTTITLRPQDDFTISGFDIDVSTDNAVTLFTETGFDYTVTIAEGENLSMTDPDGSVTAVGQVSPGNSLLYDNNGTDTGPLDILDDTFFFMFDDMSLSCGDGTQLTVAGEEELVYDLACDCIQDGMISIYEGRDLINTVDYGYPAGEGEEAVCDDEILVITPVDERTPTEEVIECP